MTAITDDDTITFSSGRTMYANNGVVGLSPNFAADPAVITISEGYDGEHYYWASDKYKSDSDLTKEDLLELADMMIERWQAFRAEVTRRTPA